jgi:hypothetical protein
MLTLGEIAEVLGVSKPTASLLRSGRYGEVATSMRPGLNAPDNSPSWELGG